MQNMIEDINSFDNKAVRSALHNVTDSACRFFYKQPPALWRRGIESVVWKWLKKTLRQQTATNGQTDSNLHLTYPGLWLA